MYPRTFFGKMIGTVCCVFGVLLIVLPLPIITKNFSSFYVEQARHKKVIQRNKEREMFRKTNSSEKFSTESSAASLL